MEADGHSVLNVLLLRQTCKTPRLICLPCREEEHPGEGDSVTKMHEDLSGGRKGWAGRLG